MFYFFISNPPNITKVEAMQNLYLGISCLRVGWEAVSVVVLPVKLYCHLSPLHLLLHIVTTNSISLNHHIWLYIMLMRRNSGK